MVGTTKINQIWFKRIRGSYLPVTNIGLAVYLTYLSYLVALAITWYQGGAVVWELMVHVIPLSIAAAGLTQYIAAKHSN